MKSDRHFLSSLWNTSVFRNRCAATRFQVCREFL
jgi:hypothetical protein